MPSIGGSLTASVVTEYLEKLKASFNNVDLLRQAFDYTVCRHSVNRCLRDSDLIEVTLQFFVKLIGTRSIYVQSFSGILNLNLLLCEIKDKEM